MADNSDTIYFVHHDKNYNFPRG